MSQGPLTKCIDLVLNQAYFASAKESFKDHLRFEFTYNRSALLSLKLTPASERYCQGDLTLKVIQSTARG